MLLAVWMMFVLIGFYLFFMKTVEERSWPFAIMSAGLWLILAAGSYAIEVPGVTDQYVEAGFSALCIGLGIISLVFVFLNYFEFQWESNRPMDIFARKK